MKTPFHRQWAAMMLAPMWIHHQASEVMVRCIDLELLRDPSALNNYWLEPAEERLNPLEFHGRRAKPQYDAC